MFYIIFFGLFRFGIINSLCKFTSQVVEPIIEPVIKKLSKQLFKLYNFFMYNFKNYKSLLYKCKKI
jgi:hypothetical protein